MTTVFNDSQRIRDRIGLCGVLALVALVAGALTASANNFGSSGTTGTTAGANPPNGVWRTNNSFFNVVQRALTSTYSGGVIATINNSYNLPAGWHSATWAASDCIAASHDTCVYDFPYGDNGLNGWNQCVTGTTSGSHPSMVCDEDHVKINTSLSPPPVRIACHEIGHSVGLRHTSESASCMKTSISGGTSEVLSVHDCDHLEAEY